MASMCCRSATFGRSDVVDMTTLVSGSVLWIRSHRSMLERS
jgi:hypothetical protein